jgi:hypothetical protein
LPQGRNKRRPRYTGESPGGQHEAVNRSNILRPKIVCCKGWHRPEPTAITKKDEEHENCEGGEALNRRQQPENDCLNRKHDEKDVPPPDEVRHRLRGGPIHVHVVEREQKVSDHSVMILEIK